MAGLRGGLNERQNLERVKADRAGKDDQFNDVDPALAALDARHEGLVAMKPDCQVRLTDARLDTGIDQGLTKGHLSLTSDCFCHASRTFRDVANGENLLSKKWI